MKSKHIAIIAMLGLATIVNSACSSLPCCAKQKEIGLQLYSLRADIKKDYAGTVKSAGDMGYTICESAGYANGKFYGMSPEDFVKSIEAVGMKVVSSHTVKMLSKEELASKNFSESLKFWDQAIEAHKKAGIKYLVMPWMKKPDTVKDLQTYCEYFNEIGKRAEKAGIKFGYHNHAFEFEKVEDKVVMFDYMIENTDPRYVFFQLDVYWAVIGKRSPVDIFKKYPKRFDLLHIKDEKELGASGMVGFDAIFKNLEIAGTKHIIVEVERYNFDPKTSVKMSFDYLNNADFVK